MSTKTRINVGALHAALDAAREKRGLSWRQLAKEIGVSPSLLSRLGNGYRPDADGFVTLTGWLGMSAEQFISSTEGPDVAPQPDLESQLAPLLRASKELTPEDVAYLEDVIQATLRRVRATRTA